jgi:hypothetical protein
MKRFIVLFNRHALPMVAAGASSSVLTWMMCDLDYMKRRNQAKQTQAKPPPEKTPQDAVNEWHGN